MVNSNRGENAVTDKEITAPRDAALAFRGYGRTLRCLVPSLIALAVLGGIAFGGVNESRAERAATCGLAITVYDPDVRASLIRFDRQQSPAASKVCDLHRDRP